MNNRYIFRGKRKDNDEWIEGYLIQGNKTYIATTEAINYMCVSTSYMASIELVEVIPKTVGQFTGLEDKNGKWIFENDIVTMPAYQGGRTKSVVYFKNGKFAVDGSNYAFKDICPRNMEVIGNIYDNPELLEV